MWIKIKNFFLRLFNYKKEIKTKDTKVEENSDSIQTTGNNNETKQNNTKIGGDYYVINNQGISKEDFEKFEKMMNNFSREINKKLLKSEERAKENLTNSLEKAKIPKKEFPTDLYKLKEIKEEMDNLYPEIKTEDDKIGYDLIFQGCLMLKFRENVLNIWEYLFEIDFKYMNDKELDDIKRTLVMIFNLFDFKVWKDKNRMMIRYCFFHIVRDCKECFDKEGKNESNFIKNSELQENHFFFDKDSEISLWMIDDKPSVKEELIKEDIWNMRLEAWGDKEGKNKLNFWLVLKKEFEDKYLLQNKILFFNIIGERNNMSVLKIKKDDEKLREEARKLNGINITKTILADKNFAKNYKEHEVWLIETYKLKKLSEESGIKFGREEE